MLGPILPMGKLRSREGRDFPRGHWPPRPAAFPPGPLSVPLEAVTASMRWSQYPGRPPPGRSGRICDPVISTVDLKRLLLENTMPGALDQESEGWGIDPVKAHSWARPYLGPGVPVCLSIK